jgi:hypothetical protein
MGLTAINVNNIDTNLKPSGTVADRAVTVDNTAGGVRMVATTSALAATTTHVFWTLETADARFTIDGSAPTTTNGHLVDASTGVKSGIWNRSMAEAAKWIRTGATSAVLSISELSQ